MGKSCAGQCNFKDGLYHLIYSMLSCFQSSYDSVSDTNKQPVNESPPDIRNKPSKQVMMQTISVLKTKTNRFDQIFSLGTEIGKGRFGTVYLCVEKETGKEYACKTIDKRKLIDNEDVKDLRREIRILQHLSRHPNVASLQGAYEDPDAVHIVMEFCAGGELFDRIKQHGRYAEQEAAKLISTIVQVIKSFHSSGVMHRDIKPENLLFVNKQEDSPLKVIDFGLSTFFKPRDKFSSIVGTPSYAAPEVLQKLYGSEADIWSAGVILYILLSGYNPFWGKTHEAMQKRVMNDDLDISSDPWPTISETAKDLVQRMLHRDPAQRINAGEVLRHQWIKVHGGGLYHNLSCDLLPDVDADGGRGHATAKAFFLRLPAVNASS